MGDVEVWREVADLLDREAARLERACALAGALVPDPDVIPPETVALGRGQWRDAGLARGLREASGQLREAGATPDATSRRLATSTLRVQSWLLARQLERAAAADEAMTVLARCRTNSVERARALARSAYALGRLRGVRMAAETWAVAAAARSRD